MRITLRILGADVVELVLARRGERVPEPVVTSIGFAAGELAEPRDLEVDRR